MLLNIIYTVFVVVVVGFVLAFGMIEHWKHSTIFFIFCSRLFVLDVSCSFFILSLLLYAVYIAPNME